MRRNAPIAALFLARSAFPQTPDDARAKMDEAISAGAVSCKADDQAGQLQITCPISSVSLDDLVQALPADPAKDKPVEVVFPMGDSWKLSAAGVKSIREINDLLDEGITRGQGGHVRFYVKDKNDGRLAVTGRAPGTFSQTSETLFMMSTAYLDQQGSIGSAILIKKSLISRQMMEK
jgi:hypothetical protein